MPNSKVSLTDKKVCVIGLGRIGLPTALLMASNGILVHGFDVSHNLIQTLSGGRYNFDEPDLEKMFESAREDSKIEIDTSPIKADYFVICVPTFVRDGEPVMDAIFDAADSMIPYLEDGNTIIIESTITPGTTRKIAEYLTEKRKDLKRLFVCHCPERLLPGNAITEMIENDKIIGGIDHESSEKGAELYSTFVKGRVHLVDDLTAELVKIFENTYRDINIALANNFANICERLGANVWQAIDLANTHPRVEIHRPGVGVGGSCVPVVPLFLKSVLEEDSLIMRARKINDATPKEVALEILSLLGKIDEPHVALLGMTYKKDVTDIRSSPSFGVYSELGKLLGKGSKVTYHDPHLGMDSSNHLLNEAISEADLLVLLVDHTKFSNLDPKEMIKHVRRPVVYDCQNFLDKESWENAGFEVHVLGDRTNANYPIAKIRGINESQQP